METKIDLSSEALQERREIAEKAYNRLDGYVMDHNNANSPTAVIAMIDEIEALRLMLAEGDDEIKRLSNNEIACMEACGIDDVDYGVKGNAKMLLNEISRLRLHIECQKCVKCVNDEAQEIIAEHEKEIERLRSENNALKNEVQRLQIYDDDLK